MSALIYTATRKLIAGHVLDVQYSMDIGAKKLDESMMASIKRHTSIGGNVETIFNHSKTELSVVLGSLPRIGGENSMQQMREFLHSVQAGEAFTFDQYGTVAVPDDPLSYYLKTTKPKQMRLGNTDRFNIALIFIEIE